MRSIRLSLVIYFLVLLTAALGAVCGLVYQTAAAALEDRVKDSEQLVKEQYTTQCDRVQRGLDHRLAREAFRVATMVRPPLHVEALYPFGMLGVPFTFQPHLNLPLWLAEGVPIPGRRPGPDPSRRGIAEELFAQRFKQIDIEAAEDLIPTSQEPDVAHEFFQIYSVEGKPLRRSQSLGQYVMALPEEFDAERPFDVVTLGTTGPKARRITLRTAITKQRFGGFPPWLWRRLPGKGPNKGGPLTKGGGFGPPPGPPPGPPGPPRPFVLERDAPTIYVQYAIDLAPTEAQVAQFAEDRDRQLQQLRDDAATQLAALQRRLLWIALATFAATFAGGYLLLRLGLTPIARLSDAVSEVSERDFRLKVDPTHLPTELQPIAHRLSSTLEQLGRAFEREKQAAADISHELRTPLAALMTTIEVALRKSRSVQEYREILEDCHISGEQMSHMVERLLALARLDAGAVEPRPQAIDAAELALGCADMIRPLARAQGLALTANVSATLPAQTDPDKLREVITNLLHNAVEYNRPGGTVELTVQRVAAALSIEVRDTGIGISPEAQGRIFERFFRADPSRHADTPHAGLGLAIVKSYVDLLGGTITVDSTPGMGTTFRVRLPVPEPAAVPKRVVA
jgi:heavy metal sensor kinase